MTDSPMEGLRFEEDIEETRRTIAEFQAMTSSHLIPVSDDWHEPTSVLAGRFLSPEWGESITITCGVGSLYAVSSNSLYSRIDS